jgi:maltose-binding protein MalE
VVPPKGLKNNAGLVASTGLVVYAKSKNKNAAWWLARFESQGKGAQVYASIGDDTPGALALYKNKAVKAEYGSLIGVQNQAYKTARRPVQLLNYDEFYSAVAKDLTPMWGGTMSAADATKKACADAKPYLNP